MDYEEICDQAKHYFMRISQILGIEWAPRDIPVDRRLQTLGAASWAFIVLFGEGLSIYLTIQLLYTRFWWLIIIYCVWMLNDIDICHQGGRRKEWVRNWILWRYYCDYFPIGLQKTQDLDPSKNYLFAIFPHGFLSSGVMGALGSNARDFPKLFPGMKYFTITLAGHFLVPLFREFLLAMGACSSSRESLLYLLDSKKNQGNCVGLIVGGAQEALHFKPGEYSILLSKRKGFIKIAIKSGAPIVPVFAFGEPDIYRPINNPEDGWLRKFQDNFRKLTGISPLLPLGRGLFQYSYGVLPLRSPINVVVGTPMEVKKNLDPTDEEIEFYHAEFTQKLIDLFETNKSKYLKKYEDLHLKIN